MSVPSGEERRDALALWLREGVGPVHFRELLERFGSPAAALGPSGGALRRQADEEMDRLERSGGHLVWLGEPAYPEALKALTDAPGVLFVRGRLPDPAVPAIAVVGSRKASLYGARMARSIARGLAGAGVAVVSGLAAGVDAAAHEGALDAGGLTVAVLPGGLGRVYPPAHGSLAERIVRSGGALVTERTFETVARPGYFPARNRILSGLCKAVVVVEARLSSGAIITADRALDQGRDVYAVPGNADAPGAQGPIRLLKQGARLVTCAEDILEESGLTDRPLPGAGLKRPAPAGWTEDERQLWDCLEESVLSAEEWIARCGLEPARALAALSSLELKGAIRALPGKFFERADKP